MSYLFVSVVVVWLVALVVARWRRARPELGAVRFVDARRVEVTLPDGTKQTLDVP